MKPVPGNSFHKRIIDTINNIELSSKRFILGIRVFPNIIMSERIPVMRIIPYQGRSLDITSLSYDFATKKSRN